MVRYPLQAGKMKTKEHSEQMRDIFVERHDSGGGNEHISEHGVVYHTEVEGK